MKTPPLLLENGQRKRDVRIRYSLRSPSTIAAVLTDLHLQGTDAPSCDGGRHERERRTGERGDACRRDEQEPRGKREVDRDVLADAEREQDRRGGADVRDGAT